MEQCRESARLTGHDLFQADAPGNVVECQCIRCAHMGMCHGRTGHCMSLQPRVAAVNMDTESNWAAYAHRFETPKHGWPVPADDIRKGEGLCRGPIDCRLPSCRARQVRHKNRWLQVR